MVSFARLVFPTLAALGITCARADEIPASPWELLATSRFNEAAAGFDAQKTGEPRVIALGQASALLGVQPRTSANIARALDLVRQVSHGNATDATGLAARYLEARILQTHLPTPDLPGALTLYRALAEADPASRWCMRAQVKFALLSLHQPLSEVERVRLFDELAVSARLLRDRDIAAEYHLLLAQTARRFRLDGQRERAQLAAALDAGITKESIRGESQVRLGDLCWMAGDKAEGRRWFEQFLNEQPRSGLRALIKTRLSGEEAAR